jgi:hypothetical protein
VEWQEGEAQPQRQCSSGLGANAMRKDSNKSRRAEINPAWSSCATIYDLDDSRSKLSDVQAGPLRGSTACFPKSKRLQSQPRYPEPGGGLLCVLFSPHESLATDPSHPWKALRLGLSANAHCASSESPGSFRIGHRGYVQALMPCGSAVEIYRPPPLRRPRSRSRLQ